MADKKRRGLLSTLKAREAEISRVARETAPRSGVAAARAAVKAARSRPNSDVKRLLAKSPETLAREENIRRIKSQSRDVSRKRTAVSVAKGKIKKVAKKARKKLRGFIPGRTKF